MKPEDLKPPFPKAERRVTIHDRVWYAPDRLLGSSDFTFPGWAHADLFGREQPLVIEYCSGNGAWIAAKAVANPHVNWLAVERKYTRVRKIWSKIKNLNIDNLIVVCGEAHQATRAYFPDNSVSEIYINFPDPWPKNRHAKNRLIQLDFVKEMWRVLKEGSAMTFVTDDPPYSEWLIHIMQAHPGFHSAYPDPFYTHEYHEYGTSYFEDLWRSKGRLIRYHRFLKK